MGMRLVSGIRCEFCSRLAKLFASWFTKSLKIRIKQRGTVTVGRKQLVDMLIRSIDKGTVIQSIVKGVVVIF